MIICTRSPVKNLIYNAALRQNKLKMKKIKILVFLGLYKYTFWSIIQVKLSILT